MSLWTLQRGDGPVVVNVPHAGTHVPMTLAPLLSPEARALPDTDWHVEKLYAFAVEAGATLMCATHSRYVVDLNRDPSGAALYAGADNTEICPTRTFAGAPVYAAPAPLAADDVAARVAGWFSPYHAALAAEVARVRARHGYAILPPAHSSRSVVPRCFAGPRPHHNTGRADGASAAAAVQACAAAVLAGAAGFTHVVNGRFKGGWITRHYGRPAAGVHALQLEVAQACYMDEEPPYPWDPGRAAPLGQLLRRLVAALAAWRPSA